MFAFVAVDEDGMIATIEDGCECGGDLVGWNGDKRFLVTGNTELEKGDPVLVEELRVSLWIFFQDQSKNGAKSESAKKGEMFLFREGGSIDVRINHGKVVWWQEIFLEVRSCGSIGG